MERFARLESPLSPLRGQLPQRGRRVGASDPLPPPLGEVAERSEAGGGLPIRRRQPTPYLHSPLSKLHSFSSFCILQTFARFAILSLVKNLGEGTA